MRKIAWFLLLSYILPLSAVAAEEVSVEEGLAKVGNSYIIQELQDIKKKTRYDWLQRTDIGLQLQPDGPPVYSIETIQPLDAPDGRITSFTQFRLGNDLSAGLVANAGIGRRILSGDKKSMYTVSAFYDYGLDYGHERIVSGVEYLRGRSKYRANVYYAVSDAKPAAFSSGYERVLSGYDYSVGTAFAYAPWAQLYIKGFRWNNEQEDDVDFKVYTQLQITPRLHIEWGYLDNAGEHYGKFLYTLGRKGPAMLEAGKRIFRNEQEWIFTEAKLLEKIEHRYDIDVETVD